jgi:PAS domain S-box-containing protein
MNLSFTAKIRLIIVLLFIISLIEGLIILSMLNGASADVLNGNITQLKMDIQNTIYITVFFQFVLAMILIFYIPVFLHRAFAEIHQILKDISQGLYSIDIDLDSFQNRVDNEFYRVIVSIKAMLESVLTFDTLKKDKIIEHHNRIISMLNLSHDGFIILDINGNIVYMNDNISDTFGAIAEGQNIFEQNYPPEIENNIKKYCKTVLKSKTKQQYVQFFVPALKRHVGQNSAIVRDVGGNAKGAVIAITNLEKKKTEKVKESE